MFPFSRPPIDSSQQSPEGPLLGSDTKSESSCITFARKAIDTAMSQVGLKPGDATEMLDDIREKVAETEEKAMESATNVATKTIDAVALTRDAAVLMRDLKNPETRERAIDTLFDKMTEAKGVNATMGKTAEISGKVAKANKNITRRTSLQRAAASLSLGPLDRILGEIFSRFSKRANEKRTKE